LPAGPKETSFQTEERSQKQQSCMYESVCERTAQGQPTGFLSLSLCCSRAHITTRTDTVTVVGNCKWLEFVGFVVATSFREERISIF